MKKFSDEWFIQYGRDELNGKHKQKLPQPFVCCRNCHNFAYDGRGNFECLKQAHGKNDGTTDEWILTPHMINIKRHCIEYEQARV